jgi:hypothetical protein
MMKSTYVASAALAVIVGAAQGLHAQGALSTQGFGYPSGQLSTRAQGTGGAFSEIDSRSPLNPAALVIGNLGQVYAQYDPELRTTKGPSGSSRTITARFPNFGFSIPATRRLVFGFSASTLLDRTWETQSEQLQTIGLDTATAMQTYRSEGGITDLRVAFGYQIGRLRVGVGGHGYTGNNRISLRQEFADTLNLRTISQVTRTNYTGSAISGGLEFDVTRTLNVAVSGRVGGKARMYANDTLLSTGDIPNRYAASVSFGGIPQTLIAVRYARELWSSLEPLSVSGARASDATDIAAGVESAGPRIGARAIVLRLGARHRTLPFHVGTTEIKETSFGGGFGIPLGLAQLGGDRAGLDFSVLRSARTSVGGVNEHAFNFSFGMRVQP